MSHALTLIAVALFCTAIAACRKPSTQEFAPQFGSQPAIVSDEPQYRFGVQPMRTTRRMWERYSKLVDALNQTVSGFHLRLVSAQTDETYRKKLNDGMLDVAIVEPNRVLEAEPLGYRTIARAANGDRIAGVIVVRRDSGILQIRDLRDKTIAFSSPDSLAGTMLVRMYLHDAGLKLKGSGTAKYVGSQESALVEVATHGADAAGVSRDGWHQFLEQNHFLSERLEARWVTEELPGAAVMVGPHLSREHARELQRRLLGLRRTTEGSAALARAGFTYFRYGEEASYDELWEFLTNYRRVFRPQVPPRVVE